MKLEELQKKYEELGAEIEKLKSEDVVYDEARGLFDKQLVWCWDDYDTHSRILGFYDAKNRCTFDYQGDRDNSDWDNYTPYEGDYPEWAVEGYKTLED